MSNIDI